MNETRAATPRPFTLYGGVGLAILVALYLLPGLIGHDPWRGDDGLHFSAVLGMLRGDGWLMPQVAGESATAFPPLYYWVAALFAAGLGWLMPVHDASRLSTALFAALAIVWIARAAERLYGRPARLSAGLLTLGCLGLVVHAHEHQPLVALLAMQALTLAGLSRIPEHPLQGGLMAACGASLAFLASGLPGLLLTLPLFVIIALACPECRTPRASGALILGISLAFGASALWPIALNHADPTQFNLWWADSVELLTGPDNRSDGPMELLELLGWFAWPLWPLATWTVWRHRRTLTRLPLMLPLLSIALATVLLWQVGRLDPARALPLIPGLALLAAAGLPTLRRGAANAFDWFALMTFGVFAVLVWLAWSAQVFHWPPGLARSLARSAPDFVLQGSAWQIGLGSAIMLVWFALISRLPRSSERGPGNWAMGMTMLWCLTVTLLLPWFDNDRSYRPIASSLAIALSGEAPGCVAALGLGPSHRAALDYFADLRTETVTTNETNCPYLLVRLDARPPAIQPDINWQQIWEDRHGGGKRLERFRLYRRE